MEFAGKFIVIIGAALVVVGVAVWLLEGKLGWFGHLPGDIRIERSNFRLYIPVTTILLVSVALSLVWWAASKLLK